MRFIASRRAGREAVHRCIISDLRRRRLRVHYVFGYFRRL
jgi:hypothetical protein